MYKNQILLENKVLTGSVKIDSDNILDTKDLYNYDKVEYFYITTLKTGEKIILGNNVYYEDRDLTVPKEGEYYGGKDIDNYRNLGSSLYLDLTKNSYYFNLDIYQEYLDTFNNVYFYSDNKDKMLEVQENTMKNTDLFTNHSPLNEIQTKYYIFYNIVILFFTLLMFIFLFVDINMYNKEIVIKKILGYNSLEVLLPIIKRQMLYSIIYFLFLIVPIFILINNYSVNDFDFFISFLKNIITIYIVSNLIYIVVFIYKVKKSNIIMILKGKLDATLINNVSMITNVISKILITLILCILLVPSYNIYKSCEQYILYIRGNENYVSSSPLDSLSEEEAKDIYIKFKEDGAVINARSMYYEDSPEYYSEDQIMIVNYNYANIINQTAGLEEGRNYLFIPEQMKEQSSEIIKIINEDYLSTDYKVIYYVDKEIYTYMPSSYSTTNGYINYPIVLLADDWTYFKQESYALSNMYYIGEGANDITNNRLVSDFYTYLKLELSTFISLFISSILLILLVIISTYYMFKSHMEINGKEIAVKKILGYSKFRIYNTFYILDFIYYVFGAIIIFIISSKFSISLWFSLIFILMIVILNEYNRRVLIRKIEKRSIINIIKGEI